MSRIKKKKEQNRKEKKRAIAGEKEAASNVETFDNSSSTKVVLQSIVHSALQLARTSHKYMRMGFPPSLQRDATHRQSLYRI